MAMLDGILAETETQFGLSNLKSTSLLSSLLSLINDTPGGLTSFLDRFRKAGLGESVSSWLSNATPRAISGSTLESAVGHDWIDKIASRAGLSYSAAASALAFMIPNVVQRLAPGGAVPTRLPADALAYAGSATSAVAAGARQAAYAGERAVRRGIPGWLWAALALLALILIGFGIFGRRHATNTAFNLDEQVRLGTEKATAALAALHPGFSANDLVSALNLNVINFPSNSAQIPADSMPYLNRVAEVMKAAPAGTVLEVGGHTDNTGDPTANMQLSQQRAEAVRGYLIQQGVSANMLVAKGYGDSQPVATNDTDEGKFRNRRIEFKAM
jgi:outer membrane protein OmpA-like peptidoglycan-associated protein